MTTNKVMISTKLGIRKIIACSSIEAIYENIFKVLKKEYIHDLYLIDTCDKTTWFKKSGMICIDDIDTNNDKLLKKFIFEFKLENGSWVE